ncbi:MAG: T9SS type A sorting domain-containing protein [Bacteroidetes bacterium]|nr:T9SS type A sorting domain-containing protein [Bacteroidota bacterium]
MDYEFGYGYVTLNWVGVKSFMVDYNSIDPLNFPVDLFYDDMDYSYPSMATGTDMRTECNSYTWIDGNTYTASNNSATFNIVGGAANGCDSLVTLDLTILNSAAGTDTKTECNSYTWIDGNTYTASNSSATFNIVGGAANGCDSLVTLDLTILNSAAGTDTKTVCNSYTWIDGNTYTASNNSATFNIVGGAANGCDSLVTLDLTILNSATGTDTKTECNSYTWIDGNTYTASNNSAIFNIVGGAANGCDSLVTLDLTINSVSDLTTSTSGVTISANNTLATYQWLDCDNNNAVIASETQQSFTVTTNGNYAVELTENGCVDTSACVAITTVGIIENSFGDGLIVYPNPSSGDFSINLVTTYENIKIVITDISGKMIESKTTTQSQILNLCIKEPIGIYIVSIQAGNKSAVIRLVKE